MKLEVFIEFAKLRKLHHLLRLFLIGSEGALRGSPFLVAERLKLLIAGWFAVRNDSEAARLSGIVLESEVDQF